MSTNKVLNEYRELKAKKEKSSSFTSDSITYISIQDVAQDINAEVESIIRQTTMSMKSLANAYYKSSTFLEASDIEQIKASLNNYAKEDLNVSNFKKSLISDLTVIQSEIQKRYSDKLSSLQSEKRACERQVKVLDFAKNKLIMDRLSKIQWPYDAKTQDYDNKMVALNAKIENYGRKIEEQKKMRPAADEKDLLIYQMQLKEKYIK